MIQRYLSDDGKDTLQVSYSVVDDPENWVIAMVRDDREPTVDDLIEALGEGWKEGAKALPPGSVIPRAGIILNGIQRLTAEAEMVVYRKRWVGTGDNPSPYKLVDQVRRQLTDLRESN